MDAASYVTLSRQSGLMREMRIVANNIANAATTGYRQEGLIFSEFVESAPDQSSLSMSQARVRNTSMAQGALTQTNGTFDFAIEGDGFFMVETEAGERLTRAGSFSSNADGDLVTMNGQRVLDAGGAPVFVPPGVAGISVAADGTLSADGQLLGQIGLFQPIDPLGMVREDGVMFRADAGVDPAENATVLQGFVEGSNVNPILQVSRMIEIQRAYEMGQSFLETEDQRIRNAVKTLIK
ncbi:flagellar hook-basal body complex protein [Sedimentitalea nanhaiensis]|uniref:Flagellar basal-body rod protein FlgF n=1 Tax=Sedimentitalea nanhaiensis TaxID=999627 RepID=A0A1I7C856_9RHOB|nr:flagellar hook-basal body complex protein [Sedimentitalea nanhaiensis]SFT95572.1 flagellar basal-body rod protein FlgF [Sedimentitalea nanhaiensis]